MVYVEELLKIKHYATAIQKWEILDSSENTIRISNESIVVWEKFDNNRGKWDFSSIVNEGSIDYNFEEKFICMNKNHFDLKIFQLLVDRIRLFRCVFHMF